MKILLLNRFKENGETAHHEQVHFFSQCFQKSSAAGESKCVCLWERSRACIYISRMFIIRLTLLLKPTTFGDPAAMGIYKTRRDREELLIMNVSFSDCFLFRIMIMLLDVTFISLDVFLFRHLMVNQVMGKLTLIHYHQ